MEKRFTRSIFFVLIITILLVSSFTLCVNSSYAKTNDAITRINSLSTSSYISSPAISITANSGFISAGFTGSGTQAKPYILNGYSITTATSGIAAISILGTTAYFIIENCYLTSSSYSAIYLSNVNNGVITNNIANQSTTGMDIENSANIRVSNNLITNSLGDGLYSYISNFLTITNNTIIFSQNNGINSYGNGNSTISYNNVSYDDISNNPSYYGITDEYYSSNMTYSHNIVDYNGNDGIWTYLYGPQTISDNTVQFNIGNGVYFGFGGPAGLINMYNNYITNNTADGINIDKALNNTVTNNTILYNGGNGVNFGTQNYNNTVNANTIIGNSLDGVLINSSSGGVAVNDNLIANNLNNGINLNYDSGIGSNATITNNTVSENGVYGLKDAQNNNNTITYNTFINNSVVNLYMYNVSNDKIYLNNFLEKNTTCGCQVQEYNTTNSYTNGHFGNYWSDYTGLDANGDGIGDTNYTLAGSGVANDSLPLMHTSTFEMHGPSKISYNEGTSLKFITWYVYTYDSVSANLYINGTLDSSYSGNNANWNKTTLLNFGGKSAGTYIIKFALYDLNTSIQTQVVTTLTILDVTSPVLSISSNSITYVEGSTGNDISFKANDLHPGSYVVYQNGSQKLSGTWTTSANITISIDGLSTGFYNFTVVVYDQSHNSASVIFTVHVTPKPVTSSNTNSTSSSNTGSTSTISASGFDFLITILSLVAFVGIYWKRKYT